MGVLEMDGTFDNIQELAYIEGQLSNTSTKYYGELTQAMLQLADAPGSNNGTGLSDPCRLCHSGIIREEGRCRQTCCPAICLNADIITISFLQVHTFLNTLNYQRMKVN